MKRADFWELRATKFQEENKVLKKQVRILKAQVKT